MQVPDSPVLNRHSRDSARSRPVPLLNGLRRHCRSGWKIATSYRSPPKPELRSGGHPTYPIQFAAGEPGVRRGQ
jgi:hypothetical protein